MRTIAFAIALCLTGAALAQHSDAPLVFVPEFEVQPTPTELVRNYPPRALQNNISGIGVLCCTPRPDRSLDCAVSTESPAGHGFGDASVRAAASYRLSPASHADLAARPGTSVRISLLWAGPLISPEQIEQLRASDRDTMYACLPPSVAN